jgi:subtilisin family serine protease
MKSLFVLFGLIAIMSGLYLTSSENFESLQLTQVFAQSENKKFENATTIQSSATGTDIKSKENKSQNPSNNSQSNGPPIEPGSEDKETFRGKSFQHPKIHPAVSTILENANPKAMAKLLGAEMDDDQLFVYVHLKEKPGKSLDLEIISEYKNTIFTKLNYGKIQSLVKSEAVEKITLPDYAVFYGHAKSEGIEFSGADSFHNVGINGTGITVAIIDDSFITSNLEISANIVNQTFFPNCSDMTCGFTDGNSHGTAVAEIIVDMAPGVSLELYTIKEKVGFLNAVDDAIAKDVDIITASLGFPTIGGEDFHRDGTSEPAQKVNEVTNSTNQILFTVASGNDGIRHWKGIYNQLNVTSLEPGDFQQDMNSTDHGPPVIYESVMMFNSSATGNMRACLPVTAGSTNFDMFWNDWKEPVDNDYDFFLYERNMTGYKAAASGLGYQNGTEGQEPREFFFGFDFGEKCLVLASDNSTEDHLFHIYLDTHPTSPSYFDIPLNDDARLGSMDTPADATGAFTIGAVNFNNSTTNYSDDFLEIFSSQGPTDDARPKPEICGPDGTLTHQTTLAPSGEFLGTSAATPHVAAAAALLLEQNPTLDVNQLKQKLIDDARGGIFSADNKCGSDSGSLRLVLDSTITITKTTVAGDGVFDFTTTVTDDTRDGNFTGNGGFSIDTTTSNTITFSHLSPDLTYTITESPESGWQLDSLSCTGGTTVTDITGTTVTLDPDPGEQIDCTYTNSISLCSPPASGDWVVDGSCEMSGNATINGGSLIVQNNSVLTIPNGVTLDIDFANHNLTVKFGSGILIKSGGAIT